MQNNALCSFVQYFFGGFTMKTVEEKMALADEISRGYFRQGLNCTECVLKTFMDIYDIDLPEDILCMATGFGGGIGHTKNICGASPGAVMAL